MTVDLTSTGLSEYPVGTVLQTKRVHVTSGNTTTTISYAAGGTSSGTLDTSGIYRLKNVAGHYLVIPNFSATSGNMCIGWFTYLGVNTPASASQWSYGIQWGSEDKRTFNTMGYQQKNYINGGVGFSSVVLDADLDDVSVNAIIRFEETNKTATYRNWGSNPATANFGTLGATNVTTDFYMIVQEIKQ